MAELNKTKGLFAWIPLVKDLHNQGLIGGSVSSSGTPSYSSTGGKLGGCYTLDGTDDYFSLTIPGTIINGRNPFTIAVWMKKTAGVNYYPVFNIGNSSKGITVHGACNRLEGGDGTNHYDNSSIISGISNDTWYHLTIVYDGSTIQPYINGTKTTNSLTWTNGFGSGNTTLLLGRFWGGYYKGSIQDFRLYSHSLSPQEIKELSRGIVGHWLGNDPWVEGTTNLAGVGATYTDRAHGWSKTSGSGWGGTDGTVTTYRYGGYMGLPYVKYSRTAVGTGGFYLKTGSFRLKNSTTYTMSVWIKASAAFTETAYNFCINGVLDNGSDGNHYITSDQSFTTEWKRVSKTFTTSATEAGVYGFMPIIYSANSSNGTALDVYYSGFLIEEKDHATAWTPSTRQAFLSDTSGMGRHGLVGTGITLSADTCRYDKSLDFNGTEGIGIGDLSAMLGGDTNASFTFNCWFKKITGEWSSKSYETILGGPSGFELEMKPSTTNTPIIRIYSWGGSGGTGDFTYPLDLWNMLTMVRTSSNAKFYLNGELKATGSAGTIPAGSYFIGAWSNITGQTYRGKVSDVRIYATALDLTAINELYALKH